MKLLHMILPLSLLAVSGFAQDVRYNFDKGANFSAFKTYKWVKVTEAPEMRSITSTYSLESSSMTSGAKMRSGWGLRALK